MVSTGALTQAGELTVNLQHLPHSEQGCKAIINVYVNYALQYASKHYGKFHVAAFYDVPVAHPDIPGVGAVSGNLEYMIAKVDGNKDPKTSKWLIPVQPYLIVMEDKKSSTLCQNTQAQLVAQVLTLDYCEHSTQLASRTHRIGLLTDSFTWTFYYFVPRAGSDIGGDLYESSEFVALDTRCQGEILSILTLLMAGVEPKVASGAVASTPFTLNRLI